MYPAWLTVNQHLRVSDQVFELDFIDLVHDLACAGRRRNFLDFLQLSDNHGLQFFSRWREFLPAR